MNTQVDEAVPSRVNGQNVSRKLLLIWQHPVTRKFSRVGRLEQLENGTYRFSYFPDVSDIDGFFPLNEYPDVQRDYLSAGLPAFFTNRVMSAERDNYEQY